jgi:hypothetical protein
MKWVGQAAIKKEEEVRNTKFFSENLKGLGLMANLGEDLSIIFTH